MPQNVTLYTLLISCPRDVKDEISIIQSAVDEFNELYAEPLGITIQTKYWGKSSFAQSGGKPQALLNEQFVNKCDAAVAIFWTKFGSPTDEYGSGTEEEIEIMLQSGKQVFMYFSDKPISPSQMNEDGYKKVQAFRERYKDRGIYFTYSSDDEFKKLFFAHLSMYFLSDKKIKDTEAEKCSKLKLLGIDVDGKLSEEATIYNFILNTNNYINSIRSMYQEIESIDVGERIQENSLIASFINPIEIDKQDREILIDFAKTLNLELSKNFFDLGNLYKNSLSFGISNESNLNGSVKERRKYQRINELLDLIFKYLKGNFVENEFNDKKCIRLAVQNCGKTVDEDVEIALEIPQKALLTLDRFPKLDNNQMDFLLNDCNMYDLFGINSTTEYSDYSSSKRNRTPKPQIYPIRFPGRAPDYSEGFEDELNDIFCYSVYENEDNYIVKLKVDYIKHNTTVAFPTIIFMEGEADEIPYKITSRNNPDIVEGILKIKKSENEPTAV